MSRSVHGFLVVLALAGAVSLGAAPWQPGDTGGSVPGAPGGSVPVGALDYGFGLQLDRPYQAPGEAALATLFFFNLTPEDTQGTAQMGGLGCTYDLFIRDHKDRIVWQPPPCRIADPETGAPIGPFPLPGGSFLRYPVDLNMEHRFAETGDPDGEPLPGGSYMLQARHDFSGPAILTPEGNQDVYGAPGGDPFAEVPFRIVLCDGADWPLPLRELGSGDISGYRYGDPDFRGEELVLRTEEAALEFWRKHTSYRDPAPPPPNVNFEAEMVIVSLMGWRPSGGGPSTRIIGVSEHPCHMMVQVVMDYHPGPEPVLTNPFHAVAVSRSLKEVRFVHAVVQGED